MPYDTNNINYHAATGTEIQGYFYKSNIIITPITYSNTESITGSFSTDPTMVGSGFSIDTSNGSISGTTTISSDIEYNVSIASTQVATFRIVVSTEPKFTYINTSYTYLINSAISIPAPIIQASLWPERYYTLDASGVSDATISINSQTGIISGNSGNSQSTVTYTVKIINKFIEYSQNIIISTLNKLPQISYSGYGVTVDSGTFEFVQGVYGILRQNAITSNGVYSISRCSILTQLPRGLSFDNSGNIFGIPQTISVTYPYTITFTNSIESTSVVIYIRINKRYRLTHSLSYGTEFITPELQMRRKAECLQHNSNKSNESSNQRLYKMINGNRRGIECLSKNIVKSSSSSDVPGANIDLFYDNTIPVIGHIIRTRPSNIFQ